MNETLTSWTLAPPVIKILFENLPAKDLNGCSRVCSMWNRVARIIKKRRNFRISWYPFGLDDNNQICKEIAFVEYIRNLSFEPKFALIFEIKKMCSCENDHRHESCKLLQHLPLSCSSLFCSSAGIADHTPGYEITDDLIKGDGLTALFFPDLPGVEVTIFNLNDTQTNLNFTNTDCCMGKPVKCLLGFHTGNAVACKEMGNLLQYHSKVKDGIITAGIYNLRKLMRQQHDSLPQERSFGVAFAGKNLHASSVIVRAGAENAASIEESLRTLFDTTTFGGQCIAFSFTSVGNTQHIPACQKLENRIFKKLYPSIPLFSLFGLGAIGRSSHLSTASFYDNFSIFMSSYATIYVLLSVKN